MATLFGRYEYAGELGRGATGRVFAVRDLGDAGERRAIKVVPEADAGRLIWEFSRLCQVEHPALARARELVRSELEVPAPFGLARGTLLLIEDFAEGQPLSEVLAELDDPSERLACALKATIAVAEALARLHEVSLVHGDVKPDNVLCAARAEQVTLVDLGFARVPALGSVPRGTPAYMAPELFAGVCTFAADVYALGALLYDGLRGEGALAPSRGDVPWRERDLNQLEQLDPRARAVIARLLERDHEARPSDARAALGLLLPLAVELGVVEQAPLRYATSTDSAEQRALRARTLPFTGQRALLAELAHALGSEPLVLVRGARGAGRSRLVREAIRTLQEQRAARGERVPTWVRSLDALARVRDVAAILWLEPDEHEPLAPLVRAAMLAGLALPALHVVIVSGPDEALEAAHVFDVPALTQADFELLLARLFELEPPAAVANAARAATLGLAGRACELAARLLLEQRDVRDARAFHGLLIETGSVALSAVARELASALAWWGSALSPEVARRLFDEAKLAQGYDELSAKGLLREGEASLELAPMFARELRRASAEQRLAIARRIVSAGGEAHSAYAFVALGELAIAGERFELEARALRGEGRTDEACALLSEAVGWVRDARLSLALADAERARGRYREALLALEPLASHDALLLRAELLRLGDRVDEAALLLEHLRSSEDSALADRARSLAARLAFDAGELTTARELAREAAKSADREAEVRALEVEVLACAYAGEPAEAPIERLIERATLRARGAPRELTPFLERALGRALSLRAQLAGMRGERTRALLDLRSAIEKMRALGEAHEAATYALNLGLAELESGELGPALATLQEAAQRLSRMLRSRDLARVLFNFASAALLIGDFERGARVLDEAERELASAPDHVARAFVAVLRAELAVARGALEAAELALDEGLSVLPEAARAARPVLCARAAQVAVARGAIERAGQRLREAQACATSAPDVVLEVLAAELMLALARGDHEHAERCAQRGLLQLGERASFASRLRFVLSTIEAARVGAARVDVAFDEGDGVNPTKRAALLERTALARALLERALATLGREQRAKLRAVPAYARVLTAETAVERAPSEGEPTRFRALVRASRRLFAEPSSARVCQRLAEIALELVHAERALVIAFRDAEPRVVARVELASESERLPSFSRSVVERVALEGRSLLTVEARADDRLESADSVHALHVRSVLCVELLGLGARAFVYLDDRLRPSAFGAEDLALVEALAELAGHALTASEQRRSEARRARRAELQQKRLSRELAASSRPREPSGAPLIGESAALGRVIATARRVALSDAPLLITGESGTGKELLARFVHDASPRRARAFVAESCAALPDTLLESALFGHVRGAFTGAERARKGLFEAADGGTLFLDELGEMSPSLQGKLLRVLQEGELRPLGSERTRTVDVRVIGATRRDLAALVKSGRFREDLFYRLAVVTLELPPLRERPDDVPLLVAHFLEKHARGRKPRITPSALRALEGKPWPGNVRELENEIRRALALCDGEIELTHLSHATDPLAADEDELDLHARSERLTRELVQQALAKASGNVTRAAALLGISRFGLQKILKRLQLSAK